jgi:hypothetical protein
MMKKGTYDDNIITKEIKAINVGLSLNLLTKIATDIRYGKNIVDLELLILEFFIGYHTYGVDRYRDDGTIDNRQYVYDVAFLIIIYILAKKRDFIIAFPFELLIYFTRYYKDMKPYLGIFKSIYISTLWCISIIILPSVLHDNNFDILQEPLDYVPYIFLMIATSNNKDLEDIDDDKNNNIHTIPVKYGIEISKNISKACMILFLILLTINLDQKFDFLTVF